MPPPPIRRAVATKAIKITDGVEFDTIAREWRLKWSAESDKASLAAVQKALVKAQPAIAKVWTVVWIVA